MFELDLAEGIDLAMYLFGLFEPDTYRALRRLVRPGQTMLDIGANSGIHTLPMAHLGGPECRVIAFEPTRSALGRMRRNIALNPVLANRVTAVQAYLGDGREMGQARGFYSSWRLDKTGAQHPKHFGSLADAAGAIATTLDTYLDRAGVPKVDLMKIDVDGYECGVLRGAERTLRRDHPVVVIELCPYALEEQGDSADSLLQLLRSHGYDFFDERTGKQLPEEADRIKSSIKPDSSINIVALAGTGWPPTSLATGLRSDRR
jgi:FkbM family methyltransferase